MTSGTGHPAAGTTLGPYRVVRAIGSGGMGIVYEAHDLALDRRVALKVIAPHLSGDPDFRARFSREAQALAALDSDHVVRVYAHGEAEGSLYVATQLLPDGDLGRMLARHGAPPVALALDLVDQVAAGLADAHGAGLVHRDIKPENVLLRRQGAGFRAYLGDFGVAGRLGAGHTRTRSGTVGTPSYMAPELHTGGTAGVASDVYSLGCLLWTALTGRPPYDAASEYQVVTAHLERPVPQLAGDGPHVAALNRLLARAMAKDPARRHRSAAELRTAVQQVRSLAAAGDGTVAVPSSGCTRESGQRRGAVVAAGLVGVALVLAGVGYSAARDGDGPDPADRSTTHAVTSSPTPGAPSDRRRAVDSLARALEAQGILTAEQSRCTAERWIEEAGLAVLVAGGYFDEDLDFVDQDRSAMTPAIEAAATAAALACGTPG